ncbi:MAG: aminopeptidase [Cyclobacteriaceae bacterium]
MKKKIITLIFIVLAILFLVNIRLLVYGIQQGWGQFNIIWDSVPIEDILQDPNQPDTLKSKLEFTLKVRAYAVEKLGLDESDNYFTYYDQGGKPILWNLSASEPFELKPYLWKFPFLGSMPYKGFFELDRAKKERDKLVEQGYDTRIRTVSGWSTLGILKDPILSNMLERGDGQLAEVIIHELVHATIFIKDEIDFNENLASFIGESGAQQFLNDEFGDSSVALISYIHELQDSERFKRYMLSGTKKLDSLYAGILEEPDSIRQKLKDSLIVQITNNLDTVSFNNEKYRAIFDKQLPNNAYFMAFLRYHSKEDSLRNVLDTYDGDIARMIKDLKSHYE